MESTSTPKEPASQSIDQVEYTSVPEWVILNEGDVTRPRHDGEPITNLLHDIQYDIESKAACMRVQMRLENKQAVQDLSQWRVNFDPRSQRIQLHQIRVIRESTARDYAKPENIRIIQREEDLDAYILHGEVTLLAVLEDIRIGDIIDSCYTLISEPQLLSDHFSCFQVPPVGISTGYYHLSLRFPKEQAMRWKSGTPENNPLISANGDHTRWTWMQKDLIPVEPEADIPSWQLPKDWIQITDMEAWSELSSAAFEAWPNLTDFDLPPDLRSEIEGKNDQHEVVEILISYVQDTFRYLSVKTDLGGQIPNTPDVVIERCYGDCKDLSSMLTHLLRSQAIQARPILVNHNLGKNLPDLLPCSSIFDHVIVEYQLDGKSYWVDPTFSDQGGGATGRFVPNYYYGLPLQPEPTELVEQPRNRSVQDRYDVHDTIMLDTARNLSILRVVTTATGKHADGFRFQLAHEGSEGFIKNSEQRQQGRYETDCALEPVKYLDKRDENVWQMLEIYKIDFYKSMEHNNQLLRLSLPQTLVMSAIPVPEDRKRNCNFAIPEDLDITHIVEVRSRTNGRQNSTIRRFEQKGALQASVETLYKREVWSQTSKLRTFSDHIPAEDVLSFRKLLSDLWAASSWVITAPRNEPRLHRPKNFGELPIMAKENGDRKKLQEKDAPDAPHKASQIPQRLASHPEEIKKREAESRRKRRLQNSGKESAPSTKKSFLKSLAFWNK